MKVEVPINMKFVEGVKAFAGQKAYTKAEAMEWFRKAAAVATRPFIYLSAGVSNAEFTEGLTLAAESGVKFSGCCAAAQRGRTVSPSTARMALRRSGNGSRARA
jgi:tagatose-1,6-bisphosphate aldolase